MEWMAQVDNYCERMDLSFWAEPLNAVTNASFILAALVMLDWTRMMGAGRGMARALSWVLLALGIGSFLFHTTATMWAMLADVAPILLFLALYVYAMSKDMLGLGAVKAGLVVCAFFGFAVLTRPLFGALPFVGSTADYLPVPTFLAGLTVLVHRTAPMAARGLMIGLGLMMISLTLRMVDMPLCGRWPQGTHFLWHLNNGLMLGWFIETYRRHMLAGEAARR